MCFVNIQAGESVLFIIFSRGSVSDPSMLQLLDGGSALLSMLKDSKETDNAQTPFTLLGQSNVRVVVSIDTTTNVYTTNIFTRYCTTL